MIEAFLLLSLSVASPQATPQDQPADLRRAARSAAYRYESALRRRAPERPAPGAGRDCDEIIGRFCFRFTGGGPTPADTLPEDPAITSARIRALEIHRAWLATDPGQPEAAGPLIRYLVEADRAPEAAAVARTHAWAAERTPESLFLLGLALHHAGSFESAESAFDSARAMLPLSERARLDDVSVLLEPSEQSLYRRLAPEARDAYNDRFWRFSDPFLSEEGNERRSAHYARHAWATILAAAPAAAGKVSWGRDTEEIVLRYGLPTRRERIREPSWRLHTDLSMLEVFDPQSVSFVPGALLTEGLTRQPEPGARPALERDTTRSSYAPIRTRRAVALTLQATRFPTSGGAVLAVSGRLDPDTAWSEPVSPEGVLVLMDTLGREVARSPARVRVLPDSVTVLSGEVPVPAGAWVYRLEVRDEETGQGGLAQYRIDVEAPVRSALSDLLVAAPEDEIPSSWGELRPASGLVLPTDSRVLVWAEALGLSRRGGESRYAVEWWVESADRRTVLGRAARWLGRRVGLGDDDEPVRLQWEDGSSRDPAPVAFVADLEGLGPGLYRLGLTVRDLVSGRAATAERLVRLEPGAPPPFLPAPD